MTTTLYREAKQEMTCFSCSEIIKIGETYVLCGEQCGCVLGYECGCGDPYYADGE